MAKQKRFELSKSKLAVAIATFNEERCLADCLESVRNLADEIVVVDGSSTDKTVEIARAFGAKVIITDNKPIFHINKQLAIDECKGEWILQLDADEIITPELANEITEIINSTDTFDAYWLKRKKMFLGRWIKKGGQYPDPVIRFFKKGRASLPCKSVHEQIEVSGNIGWLDNPMLHLPTPAFTIYITKDNRYSTLTALELKKKNVGFGLIPFIKYFFWEPLKIFFSLFIRHQGFQDGFPGFVFAFYSGLHKATAYVKYWEMQQGEKIDIKKDWV